MRDKGTRPLRAWGSREWEKWGKFPRNSRIGGERPDRRRWREEGGERVAAVEKIEEKRKPEDFFGHRNRTIRSES